MAMPIRLTVVAAMLLCALAAREAAAEIEVQTGRVVGERFGLGPVNFTADPFHKFDPIGGTRELHRVQIEAGFDWECVVQLANPEPVVQEIRYNAIPSFALLRTSTSVDIRLDLFLEHNGTLIADPFETVQNTHTEQAGLGYLAIIEPPDPFLLSMIGPGPIEFEPLEFRTGFDTRRFVNGMPVGVPNGFSVFRERWDLHLTYTYEYTVIPSVSTAAPLLSALFLTGSRRRRTEC